MKSEKVKPDFKPSWEKFAWAAFLLHIWYRNIDDYLKLMKEDNGKFVKDMWTRCFDVECACRCVDRIINYLDRYGCRLPVKDNQRRQKLHNQICEKFRETEQHLQALYGYEIETVCFDKYIELETNRKTVEEIIKELYNSYDCIDGFGPTPTSKLLHILQPKLFVMWDKKILEGYQKDCPQISHSGDGYCIFLKKMQIFSQHINQEFKNLGINTRQTPADYLSDKLNIKPPKTIAKYLDEYNWITITRSVVVPPSRHPDKKKDGTLNKAQLTISYL